MSSVKDAIKGNLIQEIYGEIDKLYDYLEQHYHLSSEHEALLIKQLNALKDQIYLITEQSELS